jgi:phage FluMu protein Com
MAARRVRCPECTVILDIPEDFKGIKVRCSVCKTDFRIPGVSDADILDWIVQEEKEDTTHGAASLKLSRKRTAALMEQSDLAKEEVFEGYSAGSEGFFLVRIDSHGVLFEFPAAMLESADFRASLPRKCLRCGTTSHIIPRLVIYGPVMKDCTTVEAEFLDRSTRLDERDIRKLSTREILEQLPGPAQLPPPANLPMVYWICDMCNPSRMIYAQNRIDAETKQGACCLQIQRLWRAEEFLLAVGGENSEAHQKLLSSMEKHPETPWDKLAGAMQQRIRQWFAPHRGEKFVAYCADRSHSRTEDGMAGVLVSSRRLLYHTSLRNYESEKGEPLELSFSMDNGRQMLKIQAPNWEVKNMVVDKMGLRTLRRALTEQNFTAQWH